MRKIKFIHIFLMIMLISFAPQMISPSYALFFKIDIGKSTSKITNAVKKIKAKCEKIMEDIQNSQLGQAIGDGIKNTKAAIAFAQSKIDQGMALYNKVKKEVLSGDAYKMAMVSKEIADKGVELKKLEEEKLLRQEEIKQEMELLKEQMVAKSENLMKNFDVIERQAAFGPSKKEQKDAGKEIQQQMKELENELQEGLAILEQEFNSISEEYKPQEISIGEEIAELTKELAEIAKSSELAEKRKQKSAKERIDEEYQELSIPQGTVVTVEHRKKVNKARVKKEQKNNVETLTQVAIERDDISNKKSTVKSIADTAPTLPGESERSGTSTKVLREQIIFARSYISLMIADLKTQVINEIVNIRKTSMPKPKDKFNLCDYTDPENQKKPSLLSKAASVVQEGKSKFAEVSEGVQKAKGAVEQGIEKAKEVTETVNDGISTVKNATSAVQGASETLKNGNAADVLNSWE